MNSALRNQILADRRRDRRNDISKRDRLDCNYSGCLYWCRFILRGNIHFFINRTINHGSLH